MGFLGEIRKLLFGVTSVSKSGAEKVVTKGKEIGEDLVDRGSDVLDKGKDMAGDAYEKGMDVAGDVFAKGKDIAEDVFDKAGETLGSLKDKAKDMISDISESPAVEKAGNFTEGVGKKVIDTGKTVADKAGTVSEKVGKKVLEVGGDLTEKAADLSETVGEKVLDAKDKIMEKAKELSEKASDKFDETYEKAKALEAQEALEPKGEFADTVLDASGSLLEETDDFFAKAEKFAEGNYSGKEAAAEPKDANTIQVGETTISLPEPDEKAKEMAKAAGFDDLDGDGNEVVDDAIIIEDDITNAAVETIDEAKSIGTGMAEEAQNVISEDVNNKIDEMKDMMDTVLGEEE